MIVFLPTEIVCVCPLHCMHVSVIYQGKYLTLDKLVIS